MQKRYARMVGVALALVLLVGSGCAGRSSQWAPVPVDTRTGGQGGNGGGGGY
jgi:hypothetical protein